jgi:mono/diheme cytochrome c family protein
MLKNKRNLIITALVFATAAVSFMVLWAGNDFQAFRSTEPPIQIRYDMYYQSKVGAQQGSEFFADRLAMRGHVPGTVARDGDIYQYTTIEEAEAELRNPLAGRTDLLERGKNRFNVFCATCHSPSGQDTTEVVRKGLPKPPSLAAPNAKSYSDARLYHVISAGQNIMPGYADKLKPEDRWAIVNYIRELQKAPLKYAEAPKPAAADSAQVTTTTANTGQAQ